MCTERDGAKTPDRRPVAGYARVSTTRQSRDGVSLEYQTDIVLKSADLFFPDAQVVMFEDVESGRSDKRHRYQAMMADVRRRRFRAVIAYDHDRLARNSGTFSTFLREIDRTETGLVIHKLGICSLSASGRLVLQLLAAAAEYESHQIGERTAEAWEHRKRKGLKGPGTRPFGWTIGEAGQLVENDEEQGAIRLGLALRSQGQTWAQIAEAIQALGVSPVMARSWSGRGVQGAITNAARRLEIQAKEIRDRSDQDPPANGGLAGAVHPLGTPEEKASANGSTRQAPRWA